jgi:hypothetical protein
LGSEVDFVRNQERNKKTSRGVANSREDA